MSHISKKEKKRVSKLIAEKLKSMGVKDEITFVKSGKTKDFYKRDENGQIIMETRDGHKVPKIYSVDMPIAMNVLRRTVREMRNQEPDVINAFLEMPAQNG